MLDIKMIREQAAQVRERLATRGAGDEAKVDEALALDDRRRALLVEVEGLKSQRNRISKEIGVLMGQKTVAGETILAELGQQLLIEGVSQ